MFKTIAFYEIEADKYSFFTFEQPKEIIEVFRKHRVVVGFNSNNYDIPILKRFGLFKFKHTQIDLYEVLKKRGAYIGLKDASKSLSNVAKILKLENYKDEEFDYSVLNKKEWTTEELEYIKNYNILDVKVTNDLYKHLYNFFEPFKEYVNTYDQREMKWLTCSMATFAYKTICNKTGIKEEYEENGKYEHYDGALVIKPKKSEAHGKILLKDFLSLYPSLFIQCNLFSNKCSCCKPEEKWTGDGFFNVKGSYCNKKQGKIEKSVKNILLDRINFKKQKDIRQYALKIVINSLYGAVGYPVFKNIHNYMTAEDCTRIAQDCIKFAMETYEGFGFPVIYGDTDSVFVEIPENKTENEANAIAKYIVKELQLHMPFPLKEFDLKTDDKIKHIYFFKSGDKLIKKLYIYVTQENNLVIKGMPFIKSDNSGIGKLIFDKYMKDKVINGQINFDYYDILKWSTDYLEENPDCVVRTWKVNEASTYKLESQIQAQISKRYGAGRHKLVPNDTYGVGNSTKHCTVKEFEEQGLKTENIVLNKMWKELKYFCDIPKKERKNNNRQRKQKTTLMKWFGI